MADNTVLNTGSGGDTVVTREITHGGDTSKLQGVFVMGVSGTEGAYTAAAINGDATNGIDVDVTAVVPGSGATNLGKAEDAAHASGDVGVLALAVRRDSAAVGSGTDGDYSTLNVDASGNLRVNVAAGAATALVDDAAYTPASGNGVGVFGMFDDTTPDSVDEGDAGIVRMSANRNLYVTLRDAAGNERGLNVDANGAIAVTDGSASLTVDNAALAVVGGGVEATALRVTLASDSTGVVSVDDNGASLTVDNAALSVVGGGAEATALRVTIASDSTGTLSVDDGGGVLTVDGTVTANLSATDNAVLDAIQAAVEVIDNAIAGTEMQVDIVAALPAGTNNIGDVDVLSVVPGTGATALGKAIDTAAGATDTGVAMLAVRDDALTTLTPVDGDYVPLRVGSTGALHVNIISGIADVTNQGTFAVQIDGSALTALQLIDNSLFQDDAAFTPASSFVNVAGFQADETATDSVDEGDAGAARMTLDRKQIVTPQPHTAGGLSIFRSIDLDESEEEVKATAGQVYSVWVSNLATTTRFVKFYNATAANVTVGTTTPVITIAIPGNTTDDVTGALTGGGFGIAFDTAITVAATTGVADADTGAPGASEVLCNVFFK